MRELETHLIYSVLWTCTCWKTAMTVTGSTADMIDPKSINSTGPRSASING